MYDEPETGTHRKVISPAYCRNPLHSGRGGGQILLPYLATFIVNIESFQRSHKDDSNLNFPIRHLIIDGGYLLPIIVE